MGIWYCTYIWLTVSSPVVAGAFGPKPGCVIVLFSPPTKKLPCSLIVSGPSFFWPAAGTASMAASRRASVTRSFIRTLRSQRIIPPHAQLGAQLVCHRVRAHAGDIRPGDWRRREVPARGRRLLGKGLLGAPGAHDAARADRADRLHRRRVAAGVADARIHRGAGEKRSRRHRADGARLDGRRLAALGPGPDRRPDLSALPDP